MDRKEIEARIAQLKDELAKVEGRPTEVYSRIVGYYRSVRNWNAGKREEYNQRLVFTFPPAADKAPKSNECSCSPASAEHEAARAAEPASAGRSSEVAAPDTASLRGGVLVFTKKHCPNCPPVKNFVVSSGIKAQFIDAEEDEGLALAKTHGIMATPTVLGFDAEGRESFRAFDVKSLRERLGSSSIAAAKQTSGSPGELSL